MVGTLVFHWFFKYMLWDRHGVLKQSLFLGEGEGCLQTNQKPVRRDKSPCLDDSLRFVICTGASVGANFLCQVRFFSHDVVSWTGQILGLYIYSGITETTNTTDTGRYYIVYVWILCQKIQPEKSWPLSRVSVNYGIFSFTLQQQAKTPLNLMRQLAVQ